MSERGHCDKCGEVHFCSPDPLLNQPVIPGLEERRDLSAYQSAFNTAMQDRLNTPMNDAHLVGHNED